MDSEIENSLEDLIDGSPHDMEWAREEYEEAIEQVEERAMEDLDEEQKQDFALGMVESEAIYQDRLSRQGGEKMELEILAIGQAGIIENWGQENETVVYSYGFVYGPLGDDGKEKAASAVFINKEEVGQDLHEVKSKFHTLNTMKATYSVSESDDLSGVYECWPVPETELQEQELDSLPADRDEKNEILRQAITEATLATLHEDLTARDPESGFTHSYGADLRRIEGKIVDWYIDEEGGWGRYTIMDDSVTEDDIVGTDIVSDDANIPGLTVWADPDFHMEYGRKSRCDFYGTLEEGDDGNFQMNLVGIVPIMPMPMEEQEQADEDVEATESEI